MEFDEMISKKAVMQDEKTKSGGAYYFKSWSPKTEESPRRRIHFSSGKKDGFTDWRNFMKEYLKEKDEKPKTSSVDSKQQKDVTWSTHVEGARQVHMKKARELAQAVSNSKQQKSAKMFQQRYEISERYALVKEPTTKTLLNEKLIIQSDCEKDTDESVAMVTQELGEVDSKDPQDTSHASLQPILTSVAKLPDKLEFVAVPEPWRMKPDPIPPPTHKNFNRSARGFVGSYLTSYY